jgi:hypothetical protein
MIKKLWLICLLLLSAGCYAQNIIPPEKRGKVLQSFFTHPGSALFTDIILSMDNDNSVKNKEGLIAPLTGFITEGLCRYKNEREKYEKLGAQLKNIKNLYNDCLKLSLVKDTLLNWGGGHNASVNDLHWGGFFASGDTRYLDVLISEMKYSDSKDLTLYLAAISAKWSLCSNAITYTQVKDYLESIKEKVHWELKPHLVEVLNSDPGAIKDEMMKGIRKIKGSGNSQNTDSLVAINTYEDNGLQLVFFVTGDVNFFTEWQKPDMPQISPVKTYKRGDDIFPIIIFGTDGKDDKGNADLTYDIDVKRPDGSIYGHFDQLIIWKDEPATMLYLAKQPLKIHIEKGDPAGIYRIEASVYENNKKVKINFSLAFKVEE